MHPNKHYRRGTESTIRPCTLAKHEKNSSGVDRISSLPVELVSQILSLLSLKEAVATSILARRWRRAFAWLENLEFNFFPTCNHCPSCPHLAGKFATFEIFVDSVLRTCQSENLSSFGLRSSKGIDGPHCVNVEYHICSVSCLPILKCARANSWINFPLTHGIRELDICLHVREPGPGKLTGSLFSCETLEVLKLDTNLNVEIPFSFCLPRLKVFHIGSVDINIPDDDFISKLVASCPSLEDMAVTNCISDSMSIHIDAPSLRKLILHIRPTEEDLYNPRTSTLTKFRRSRILLVAPNLQYLEYNDQLALQYSIGNMDALAEAQIWIDMICGDEEKFGALLGLLRQLTKIRELTLGSFTIELLEDSDSLDRLPVFGNLKHLQLSFNTFNEWRKMLLELLDCSPFLEVLAFPGGIAYCHVPDDDFGVMVDESERQYWSTTQAIPSCVRFHLKKIVIHEFWGLKQELEMVGYFLRNASVLEEMVVCCREHRGSLELERCPMSAIEVERALMNLPKASVHCTIDFRWVRPYSYGRYLTGQQGASNSG